MELPNLAELKEAWNSCQNQEPVSGGFYAIIEDDGMQVPFFASKLSEWKDLWPAFIFKEALWDEDYDIYDEDELNKAQKLLDEFEHAKWDEADFSRFNFTTSIHSEITVEECGPTHKGMQNMVDRLRNNMG
ncbi:hypothetical protein ACFLQ5_01980 [Bacteroidota bacterium]